MEEQKQNQQEQLNAVVEKLRVLSLQNQELVTQTLMYKTTDYYQRMSWIWVIVKEGKDIVSPDFYNYCMEELKNMIMVDKKEEK